MATGNDKGNTSSVRVPAWLGFLLIVASLALLAEAITFATIFVGLLAASLLVVDIDMFSALVSAALVALIRIPTKPLIDIPLKALYRRTLRIRKERFNKRLAGWVNDTLITFVIAFIVLNYQMHSAGIALAVAAVCATTTLATSIAIPRKNRDHKYREA